MESRHLGPASAPCRLPIAQVRSVFEPADVERRLQKLQKQGGDAREHDSLRTTYERMLERGPERFQVKPAGIPDMADLYDALPNFTEVLDDVRRHVALAQDSRDGLEVTPMLLLGPPGIGKTHFAQHLADLIGTGMNLVPMGSMTAGWLLSGSASQWKGARPGKVFDALVEGTYANPVIVVDEIDKANADAQYDPLGALYGLLETDTARCFIDQSIPDVTMDARHIRIVATANDVSSLPEALLSRLSVFTIEPPTQAQMADIVANIHLALITQMNVAVSSLLPDELVRQAVLLSPRLIKTRLETCIGHALLAGRTDVQIEDWHASNLGVGAPQRARIGFVRS